MWIHKVENAFKNFLLLFADPFNDDLRQKKNVKKYTRFLLYVAKNATRKWEEIGGKLDIPPNELDTLKADHKSEGTAETAYQMLVRWRRRDHKPTLKKLLVALIATDLVEVAQKVPGEQIKPFTTRLVLNSCKLSLMCITGLASLTRGPLVGCKA